MNQVQLTDEMLRSAFQNLGTELIEEWEHGKEVKYEFSELFEHRMERLIRKQKMKENLKEGLAEIYRFKYTKVAVAIISIFILSMFHTMYAKAAPLAYYSKMEYLFDEAVNYYYVQEIETDSFTPYELGYIPMGYKEVDRYLTNNQFELQYENKDKDRIIWTQMMIGEATTISLNMEYTDRNEYDYKGENLVVYTYRDGSKFIYYEKDNCAFMLICDDLSDRKVLKILKNMEIME